MNSYQHSKEYLKVLKSKRWKALRDRLRPKNNACARCGKTGYELTLHHKTYERLGQERDDDVEFLCPYCHPIADEERSEVSKKRSQNSLYNARLNGWASKIYGPFWREFMNVDEVERKFSYWLQRNNYD